MMKVELVKKISHIFPYLYYRLYQYYYEYYHEEDTSSFSAFTLVAAVKLFYMMSVIFPVLLGISDCLHIGYQYYNYVVLVFIAIAVSIVGFLWSQYRTCKPKYNEMMSLWNNETESQRDKKWWVLVFVCVGIIPFFLIVIKMVDFFISMVKTVV